VAPTGTHEVWLELISGSRTHVGTALPDTAAASEVARRWVRIAVEEPDVFHETMPGSGVVVKGSAIVAVRAEPEVVRGRLAGPREGWWI
jgi:hypothetical protein